MKHMIGGIGDIFLSLGKAQQEGECAVYSHFSGAKKFVESFGIKVPKFVEFNSVQDFPKPTEGYIGHDVFPNIKINKTPNPLWNENKPIVGIHPFGSSLSNDYWLSRNQPAKYISKDNIEVLIDKLSDKYSLKIFGSEFDLAGFRIEGADNACVDIEDLPSAISECYAVIGTDSAIKTISSAMRIPTAVVIGNYPDPMRDSKFLVPYMKEGIMNVGTYEYDQDSKLLKDIGKWIRSL
jgi:ADP-heptose:LPS heptosyltransferase